MGGWGYTIAVKPRRRGRPEPLDTLARAVGEQVAVVIRYKVRRKRDLVLSAFREEHEEWREGPGGTLSLGFSDSCPAIVAHMAVIALMGSRSVLEEQILPRAGYSIDHDSPWAMSWVPPARVACWGSARWSGYREWRGPFVRAGADDPDPEAAAFGWRELEPASGAGADDDSVIRHARLCGLCACDMCTSILRFGAPGSTARGIGTPARRASREPVLRRARERLDGLGSADLSPVVTDLMAWDWTPPWPRSLDELHARLGQPALDAVELAAMLALVPARRGS